MATLRSKPVVTVYVRHRDSCNHASRGQFYRGCDCAKWLRYSRDGRQYRQAAETRTWGIAEDKAADLQKQLDAGEVGTVAPIVEAVQPTISQTIDTYLKGKLGSGASTEEAVDLMCIWRLLT